ncbi:MAG: 3-phosphoshikimate 1-carboxyvinyltransferase [Puniceicoccaceae bacterium]
MNELPILPFRAPARGTALVPGSKSLSNRALLLAYLSGRTVEIRGLLRSRDTEVLRTAFASLAVAMRETGPDTLAVEGCSGLPPVSRAAIAVDNAGTVARFLPAALSLLPRGRFDFDGSAAMRKRPMAGLLDCLETLGSTLTFGGCPGHFPFRLEPRGWRTDRLTVDASRSSQILSALLLAATRAPRPIQIALRGDTVSHPFVEMTLRMIASFGGSVTTEEGGYRVDPGLPGPADGRYEVEPDATAASYFFALPLAAGGAMRVTGFPDQSLQGDLGFLSVLRDAGLGVDRGGRTGITVRAEAPPRAVDCDFNAFSDTFLTLAALAPLFPGPVRIRGIAHTRLQETDRVAAMATELRKLGARVEEEEGALAIQPDPAETRRRTTARPLVIDTYEDHRVAMSFGVLGCHDLHGDGRPWIAIRDPHCCGKTFPGFFEELARVRSIAEAG